MTRRIAWFLVANRWLRRSGVPVLRWRLGLALLIAVLMSLSLERLAATDLTAELAAIRGANYTRKRFQLTKETKETMFEVRGTGQVIGRQFSVVTDEPLFGAYQFVMEGNNEIDIDGRERALDYLGTECSFGFCWGYRNTYAGLRSGMTLVENAKPDGQGPLDKFNRLSVYRFHDTMPIRFNQSLTWHLNWREERYFTSRPDWDEAVRKEGCWVDYAMVHYWYQSTPGGFTHAPLPPPAERAQPMLPRVTPPAPADEPGK